MVIREQREGEMEEDRAVFRGRRWDTGVIRGTQHGSTGQAGEQDAGHRQDRGEGEQGRQGTDRESEEGWSRWVVGTE